MIANIIKGHLQHNVLIIKLHVVDTGGQEKVFFSFIELISFAIDIFDFDCGILW